MVSTREKIESHDTSLVLSFIKGVHELHGEVQTVRESFQNRSISASASGVITALCYHLTKTEVVRFEITEQLASVEIRGVSVPGILFKEIKEQATKTGLRSAKLQSSRVQIRYLPGCC
jgi:vacuolar-type H+-ATPase subunit D/Vma8